MFASIDLLIHYCYLVDLLILCFFFFKQKTAYEMRISDWSSDVCSSDLSTLSDVVKQLERRLGVRLLQRTTRVVRPTLDGEADRKSVVEGKSVSVRVDLGGRRIIKKKIENSSQFR